MKYLIDTNVISELISKQPNQNVLNFLKTISIDDIYLSVITVGEIQFGIEKLNNKKRKTELLLWFENELLEQFRYRIIQIDTNIMLRWAKISNVLKKSGKPMPLMDLLIGATCIEKDFQNLDIKIINPFEI